MENRSSLPKPYGVARNAAQMHTRQPSQLASQPRQAAPPVYHPQPVAAQPKLTAPPVYRPQPVAAQPKLAAPPVYRPQPVAAQPKLAAPPVYRPQPVAAQPKLTAPPVYRPLPGAPQIKAASSGQSPTGLGPPVCHPKSIIPQMKPAPFLPLPVGQVLPGNPPIATGLQMRPGLRGPGLLHYQRGVAVQRMESSSVTTTTTTPSSSSDSGADIYQMSFEASGDASFPLEYARLLAEKLKEDEKAIFGIQVGIYEDDKNLMPGTKENIEALHKLEAENRGRLRVRINTARDATADNSPTRYNAIMVRNLMAANSRGSSDTSKDNNEPLAQRVIGAQSKKLKESGQLHFAASGNPYFKPGKHRVYVDTVPVDAIAEKSGLTRYESSEYEDDFRVEKNEGKREVGVHGTYTRVFAWNKDSISVPVEVPNKRPGLTVDGARRGTDRGRGRGRGRGTERSVRVSSAASGFSDHGNRGGGSSGGFGDRGGKGGGSSSSFSRRGGGFRGGRGGRSTGRGSNSSPTS